MTNRKYTCLALWSGIQQIDPALYRFSQRHQYFYWDEILPYLLLVWEKYNSVLVIRDLEIEHNW